MTSSLASVDPAAWDRLQHGSSPFLEHGFLTALERSGSIGGGSGWDPYFILAEWAGTDRVGSDRAALVGAIPCFVKSHSYGEYIFDFPWARAAARGGVPYYPKLVIAAPATPASGPRILVRRPEDPGPDTGEIALALVKRVRALADEMRVNTFFRLGSAGVIAGLRERFPDLPPAPDPMTVFVKLRELRNRW